MSSARSPFTTQVVDPTGKLLRTLRPLLPMAFDTPADSVPFSRWTTAGLFPLDSGYLQVIADSRSDRRLLVLLTEDGATARVARIDAPIGVGASLPDTRQLLMVRRSDVVELVLYRWQWLDSGDSLTLRGGTRP